MRVLRAFLFVLFNLCVASPAFAAGEPNLLFILTDQQRRDTLGAYGNSKIKTPHLDSLAGSGVLFESAYVTQPLCSPSRASLLTGLYPHTHGVTTNNIPLNPKKPIFIEMLRKGRYHTGWYGKWHLRNEIEVRDYADRLRTIVTPDGWKLTVNDRSQGELYDLTTDPKEQKNLFYDENQLSRIQVLVERIQSWQRKTNDHAIDFNESNWRQSQGLSENAH